MVETDPILRAPEIRELSESIKVIKNSRGYNWELRVFPNGMTDNKWIKRIIKLNNKLEDEFSFNKD